MNERTPNSIGLELTQIDKRMEELANGINDTRVLTEKKMADMTQEQVDAKMEIVKGFEEELVELQAKQVTLKAEKAELESRQKGAFNSTKNVKVSKGASIKDSNEFTNVFAEMIKTGNDTEYKKFLSTDATDGSTAGAFGVLVPTIVESTIQETFEDYSGLFNDARFTQIAGSLKIPVEISNTGAENHVEGAVAPAEEEITLDEAIINPEMIKKWITWTDELEIMSAVDLLAYLYSEFTREIIKKAEKDMLFGAIDGKGLEGIVEYAGTDYVSEVSIPETGFTFAQILSMLGNTKGDNVRFYMNRKTFYNDVMAMVDTTGRPIWSAISDNNTQSYTLFGAPVRFIDALNPISLAGEGEAVIVAMNQGAYHINAPKGRTPMFILDRATLMTEDKSRLLGKLYLGGRPRQLEGATVLLTAVTEG